MADIYGFTAKTIDGASQPLADYRDKVLLVVNVASKCGLTPQYDALQKIHAEYADKGFAVLGFPCNQFGGQEPGSDADVKAFVAGDPKAIGYVDSSAVDGSVKAVLKL